MSFDDNVLRIVKRIPRGKVATYKDVAESLGTKAYRAVGQAVRRNPRPVEVPCHRVVKSSGEVGGYAGKQGSRKKVQLLRKEGVHVEGNKVRLEKYRWKI